jgi:hypothetical protein
VEIEKVYYRHYRYEDFCGQKTLQRYYRSGKSRSIWMPTTRGGVTEAVAVVNYGGESYEIVARAVCRNDENFCYKIGREVAKERLDRILGHIFAMGNVLEELL